MPITLTSLDDVKFTVDKDVAERSILIKNMIEGKNNIATKWAINQAGLFAPTRSAQALAFPFASFYSHHSHTDHLYLITLEIDVGESDSPIPLPNVSSAVLKKVNPTSIQYLFSRTMSSTRWRDKNGSSSHFCCWFGLFYLLLTRFGIFVLRHH